MKKQINDQILTNAGKAMEVQKHQQNLVKTQLGKIDQSLDTLSKINSQNDLDLDKLIRQAELLSQQQGIESDSITLADMEEGRKFTTLTEEEIESIQVNPLDLLDTVDVEDRSWEDYLANIEQYAEKHQMNLSGDPFERLMTSTERAEISERIRSDYKMKKANCDKYDYLIAAFCGVASGLIDSFFVGLPGKE